MSQAKILADQIKAILDDPEKLKKFCEDPEAFEIIEHLEDKTAELEKDLYKRIGRV